MKLFDRMCKVFEDERRTCKARCGNYVALLIVYCSSRQAQVVMKQSGACSSIVSRRCCTHKPRALHLGSAVTPKCLRYSDNDNNIDNDYNIDNNYNIDNDNDNDNDNKLRHIPGNLPFTPPPPLPLPLDA